MSKPTGWDDAPAVQGGNERLPAGPYILGVVFAEEKKSRNGNEMLVLSLDIADGPKKCYYDKLSKRLNRDMLLQHYRITDSENALPYYKGDVKSFEESNPGFKYDFNPTSLIGKIVGANLREEEYLAKDGKIKPTLKIAFLCSTDKVRKGEIKPMEVKKIDTSFPAVGSNNGAPTSTDRLPWEG